MKTSTSSYRCALTVTAMHLAAAAAALAGSDFNGDGIQDLALGVPNESIGNLSGAGIVQVFYGSAASGIQLTAPADQVFHQDTAGVNGTAEQSDHFGQVLATGDFDGDGFDDLAIGTPEEDSGNIVDAGHVNILYGSANGLTSAGDQGFQQGFDSLADTAEANDKFAQALAAGDFDGDGFDDLAVGIPNEDVGNISNAGAVQILYGSASGLSGARDFITHQDRPGMNDSCENFDIFGAALASTDFGNDGFDDLAVGVPGEDVVINNSNRLSCGMVQVIYGTATGLADIDQTWNQGVNGLLGSTNSDDRFGSVLAAGHKSFGGKLNPEQAFLAATVPSDDDSPGGSGSVVILRANMTSDRLTSSNNRLVNLDVVPGFGAPVATDDFGASLAIADFGRNDAGVRLDLAIGAPGMTPTDANGSPFPANSGAVFVVYDMDGDVNPDKVEKWGQGAVSGLADAPELGDAFGTVIVAGNFGRSATADLAVGIPSENTNFNDVGAIQVIFSAGAAGLEPTNNQFFTQNTTNVEDQAETLDAFGSSLGR